LARYAIGDIQGCLAPLQSLLQELLFSADRDQLYFVGDLVNRGPQSLPALRFVRALGANARTVLGNHDLHLLALHHAAGRQMRDGDTLDDILAAPDRDALLDWLILQPLVIDDAAHRDFILHAGVVPAWSRADTLANARAAEAALRADPPSFLAAMYGSKPERWQDAHTAMEKHRFTINVLTRLRYCDADGRIDLKMKDAPGTTRGPWLPWFEHAGRRLADRRIICGRGRPLEQQPLDPPGQREPGPAIGAAVEVGLLGGGGRLPCRHRFDDLMQRAAVERRHARSPSSAWRRRRLARNRCVLTVPTGRPSASARSSYRTPFT
jgi:bis(5'-nucleosyl)-tetraphosphatase (symmetrical)